MGNLIPDSQIEKLQVLSTLRGNATLSQRMDYQILQLEEHLENLKKAREMLSRNPDFEFLYDVARNV